MGKAGKAQDRRKGERSGEGREGEKEVGREKSARIRWLERSRAVRRGGKAQGKDYSKGLIERRSMGEHVLGNTVCR